MTGKRNEMTDQALKEATKLEGNVPSIPTFLLRALRLAKSVYIKHEVAKEESWQSQEPNYDTKWLYRIAKMSNVLWGKKLYNSTLLSRWLTTQLLCLRTGHLFTEPIVVLNRSCRITLVWLWHNTIENMEYFLMYYSRYDRQQARLAKEVGVCRDEDGKVYEWSLILWII